MDTPEIHIAIALTFTLLFSCLILRYLHSKTSIAARKRRPLLGVLPKVWSNKHRLHDWMVEVLQKKRCTVHSSGLYFTATEWLVTADPENINFITSKHYDKFHKGSNFNEFFDVLGDGIFNTDSEIWKYQRKIAHVTFTNPSFRRLLTRTVEDKVEKGLIPILNNACQRGQVVDLQDIFSRYTSDVTFILLTGYDPGSLSVDLPSHSLSRHVQDVEEGILVRHILPRVVWKLQRWLGLGQERRLKKAWEIIDKLIYEIIEKKNQGTDTGKENSRIVNHHGPEGSDADDYPGADLLGLYMKENYGTQENGFKSTEKFLRDTFINFLAAGQDTSSSALAWFFWLLSKNPTVEAKIKQELADAEFNYENQDTEYQPQNRKEYGINIFHKLKESNINKLVYLHGAICEALRLYPPIALEHRAPRQPMTLPSGHHVNPWTMIILDAYAMGRMKLVWGEDCLEFKPERWITEQGGIKHQPAHKFFTFNAGPRICLGREIAFTQMKAVISSILMHDFLFQVVEGHPVEKSLSVVLSMKHGLKVKVSKRDPATVYT